MGNGVLSCLGHLQLPTCRGALESLLSQSDPKVLSMLPASGFKQGVAGFFKKYHLYVVPGSESTWCIDVQMGNAEPGCYIEFYFTRRAEGFKPLTVDGAPCGKLGQWYMEPNGKSYVPKSGAAMSMAEGMAQWVNLAVDDDNQRFCQARTLMSPAEHLTAAEQKHQAKMVAQHAHFLEVAKEYMGERQRTMKQRKDFAAALEKQWRREGMKHIAVRAEEEFSEELAIHYPLLTRAMAERIAQQEDFRAKLRHLGFGLISFTADGHTSWNYGLMGAITEQDVQRASKELEKQIQEAQERIKNEE
jgi:hypothetical protein